MPRYHGLLSDNQVIRVICKADVDVKFLSRKRKYERAVVKIDLKDLIGLGWKVNQIYGLRAPIIEANVVGDELVVTLRRSWCKTCGAPIDSDSIRWTRTCQECNRRGVR